MAPQPVAHFQTFSLQDVILATTYFSDGYYWYCFITVCLVVFPTLVVQLFSARWHYMDELMDSGLWILHVLGLGVVHRYALPAAIQDLWYCNPAL